MKIKIITENLEELTRVMDLANGAATAHTCRGVDLFEYANYAENWLRRLDLPVSKSSGAIAYGKSGCKLPNNYIDKRILTTFKMVRGAQCWYLTDVKKVQVLCRKGPTVSLTLTQKQRDYVVNKFTNQFSVAEEP